jgi:mannose-1-phosphate guanylyltransferase
LRGTSTRRDQPRARFFDENQYFLARPGRGARLAFAYSPSETPKEERMDGNGTAVSNTWAIVLAGGSGRRLAPLTTQLYGQAIPKQFAVLCGRRSLLQQTVHRLSSLIPQSRMVVVVPSEHDDLARAQLATFQDTHVITQPEDRGTGPGLALPLAWIRQRQSDATIIVSPADHFVRAWRPFLGGMRAALECSMSGRLVLLGVCPEWAETQYGWIVPGVSVGPRVRAVAAFTEKPSQPHADELMRAGALWNTLVFAASLDRLWNVIEHRLPDQCAALQSHFACVDGGRRDLACQYRTMRAGDFSRDVLQVTSDLGVVQVLGSGWSDWGTPDRVFASLAGSSRLEALEDRLGHALR